MLRGFRRARHTDRLTYHLQRIDTSLAMRQQYQQEGRYGMVLAVNYELISDATRALDALRRVEELTPDHEITIETKEKYRELRTRLSKLVELPALPLWRIRGASTDPGHASQSEIDELYRRFVESDSTSTDVTTKNQRNVDQQDPVILAKRAVAYALHSDEERWPEVRFEPADGVPGSIVDLYEGGRPTHMRPVDAAVLCGVLQAQFDLEMSEGGYWSAPLQTSNAVGLLTYVWQRHIEQDEEPVRLRFWYRQIRSLLTAAVRLTERGESFNVTALGSTAVERLSAAELPVTPPRVQLFSDLAVAVQQIARQQPT